MGDVRDPEENEAEDDDDPRSQVGHGPSASPSKSTCERRTCMNNSGGVQQLWRKLRKSVGRDVDLILKDFYSRSF